MNYKCTYIIPCWANANLSEKAIQTAINEPHSLVIAIDNASDDKGETSRLFGKLERMGLKNLELIENEDNKGWVGGINQGIQYINENKIKTEYVCFLNNDVELPQHFWRGIEPHFKENVAAVGPIGNNVAGLHDYKLENYPVHHKVKFLIGFCFVIKREILKEIGDELDPIYGWGLSDDLDISLRLTKLNYNLVIARDVKVFHHGSQGVKLKYKNDEEYQADLNKKNKIFIEKWGQYEYDEIMKHEAPSAGTIAVPHMEMVHADFFTSFRRLKRPPYVFEAFVKSTMIAKARNDLVKSMKGDWILFCDSDMTFEPDALERLIAHDLDIVGGLCFRRVKHYEPVIYTKAPGTLKWNWIKDYPRNALFEVDATGSAFLLIKRKVFEKIMYPWYEYNKDISEDLYFCHKAKEAGYKIWIDSSVKIGHLGMYPIDEAFHDNYYRDKKIVQG